MSVRPRSRSGFVTSAFSLKRRLPAKYLHVTLAILDNLLPRPLQVIGQQAVVHNLVSIGKDHITHSSLDVRIHLSLYS